MNTRRSRLLIIWIAVAVLVLLLGASFHYSGGWLQLCAGLALFLCSNASAFCTGGVYMADGGYTV